MDLDHLRGKKCTNTEEQKRYVQYVDFEILSNGEFAQYLAAQQNKLMFLAAVTYSMSRRMLCSFGLQVESIP